MMHVAAEMSIMQILNCLVVPYLDMYDLLQEWRP